MLGNVQQSAFPIEFAAFIAWQHQNLFRKTHSEGTLARCFHSTVKTPEMPGVNLTAVPEGPNLFHVSAEDWMQQGTWSQCLQELGRLPKLPPTGQQLAALVIFVAIYLRGRNLHFS